MNKLKIAVIFGGKSSEYLVSLHSSASVIKNIPADKFDVTLIGITKEGQWLYFPGNVEEIDNNTWFNNPECCEMILSPDAVLKGFVKLNKDNTFEKVHIDCVFPILHGKNGEDGTLQGLCELCGIPFIGCDMLSSALCMDKEFTHIVCDTKGIKMTPYTVFTVNDLDNIEDKFNEAVDKLKLPFFIKPANAGSSYGISKVKSYEEFCGGIKLALQYDKKAVIEATVEGFEIGCAVLGNNDLRIGEVDEIEMYQDFFGYEEKYNQKTSKIHCPARLSDDMKKKAKETALRIYRALECEGFSRVDMFVTKENEILLNEVNTIPGMTSMSRYPSMVKVGLGMGYSQLIEELVKLAMNR